jgi:uncharacterized protein (DUF2132 family)
MSDHHDNDPLHGQTLEMIVNSLVEHYGWDELGARIKIRCFNSDPSVQSSLKFLRKTPWARKKVEDLFFAVSAKKHRNR